MSGSFGATGESQYHITTVEEGIRESYEEPLPHKIFFDAKQMTADAYLAYTMARVDTWLESERRVRPLKVVPIAPEIATAWRSWSDKFQHGVIPLNAPLILPLQGCHNIPSGEFDFSIPSVTVKLAFTELPSSNDLLALDESLCATLKSPPSKPVASVKLLPLTPETKRTGHGDFSLAGGLVRADLATDRNQARHALFEKWTVIIDQELTRTTQDLQLAIRPPQEGKPLEHGLRYGLGPSNCFDFLAEIETKENVSDALVVKIKERLFAAEGKAKFAHSTSYQAVVESGRPPR